VVLLLLPRVEYQYFFGRDVYRTTDWILSLSFSVPMCNLYKTLLQTHMHCFTCGAQHVVQMSVCKLDACASE